MAGIPLTPYAQQLFQQIAPVASNPGAYQSFGPVQWMLLSKALACVLEQPTTVATESCPEPKTLAAFLVMESAG